MEGGGLNIDSLCVGREKQIIMSFNYKSLNYILVYVDSRNIYNAFSYFPFVSR